MTVRPFPGNADDLDQVVAEFSTSADHEPVILGTDKPQAVMMSYAQYAALIEMRERWRAHDSSTASVQAENLHPTAAANEIAGKWIAGEISSEEMFQQTMALYKQS